MLLARTFTQENRLNDQEDRDNAEDKKTVIHFEKADQAYLSFEDNGSMLTRLVANNLKDVVHFLFHIKKTPGDTFSKHSTSKNKMQKRIASTKSLWLSYFTPPNTEESQEEEEPDAHEDDE